MKGTIFMSLASEIETNFECCVNREPTFSGMLYWFTHQTGRIIPCSRRYFGKSFWIQECGTKYVIGLWSGYHYHCNKKDELMTFVHSLIMDTTSVVPHWTIPNNAKKTMREFDIFWLVKNRDEIFMDELKSDYMVQIPLGVIKNFFAQQHIDYVVDSSGWLRFNYKIDTILFRLSSENIDDNRKTLMNIGIETKQHAIRSQSEFLRDFPQFLSQYKERYLVKFIWEGDVSIPCP